MSPAPKMVAESQDREVADAQTAVGLRVVGVYRTALRRDDGAVALILEGNGRRVILTVMRDAEGNGPGALFVDEVTL